MDSQQRHCLVYFSFANEEMTAATLADLLEVSVENNLRDWLTGVLMYHHGMFLQILEGERKPLDSLVGRLTRDRRHRDMRIIYDQPIGSRRFDRWSMAMVGIERLPEAYQAFCRDLPQLVSERGQSALGSDLAALVNAFAKAADVTPAG